MSLLIMPVQFLSTGLFLTFFLVLTTARDCLSPQHVHALFCLEIVYIMQQSLQFSLALCYCLLYPYVFYLPPSPHLKHIKHLHITFLPCSWFRPIKFYAPHWNFHDSLLNNTSLKLRCDMPRNDDHDEDDINFPSRMVKTKNWSPAKKRNKGSSNWRLTDLKSFWHHLVKSCHEIIILSTLDVPQTNRSCSLYQHTQKHISNFFTRT